MKILKSKIWSISVAATLFFVVLTGCKNDEIYMGNDNVLRFSTDTISFDTVFTTIGSTTLYLNVYNSISTDVVINDISLGGGGNSHFRLNIDGLAANSAKDIKIRANDSLRVFVEVTIDPNNQTNPFLVKDSIAFRVNSALNQVILSAYGQKVEKLRKQHLQTSTLTNTLPYLVYDTLFIDQGATVTIDAGARFFMHYGSTIIVNGTLVANGTLQRPIVFQGDRVGDVVADWSDYPYKNAVGLWGDLYLSPKSNNHILNYVTINNGNNGLICDSVGLNGDTIKIKNLCINHVRQVGLLMQNSNAVISNSLFGNCTQNSVALRYGGNYQFTHCTISNSPNENSSNTGSAVLLNNYYLDKDLKPITNTLSKALFQNSIIVGYNSVNVKTDFKPIEGKPNSGGTYYFENCLFNNKPSNLSDTIYFKENIINKNSGFVNLAQFDYHLDSVSVARKMGNLQLALPFPSDYDGVNRTLAPKSDVGMYQYIKSKK